MMASHLEQDGPSPFNVVASVKKEAASECLIVMEEFRRLEGDQQPQVVATELDGIDGLVLDNVLTPRECEYLVEMTEKMGYTFWDSRPEKVTEFRNADTIEVFQEGLAKFLWERIEPVFASKVVAITDDHTHERWQRDLEGVWEPIGTNNNVLFARYRNGGHFAPHTDGYSIVDCDLRSMYSIVLYLNTCAEGGGTRFFEEEQKSKLVKDDQGRYIGVPELTKMTVEPVQGRMTLFFHNILHQGVPVGEFAEKYIIRSDVMYQRKDPICKTEKDRQAFQLYQEAQELSTDGKIEESMKLFRRAFKMSNVLADVYGM